MNALPATPIETSVFEAELDAAKTRPTPPHITVIERKPAQKPNQSLHAGVFKTLAIINAAILGVFGWTFRGDGEALFMVVISAIYLAAYIGTPLIMNRAANIDGHQSKSYYQFLREPFETWTGTISGRAALVQVIIIPSAILIAVIGMSFMIGASH